MKPISVQLYTLRDAAAQDLPGVLRAVSEIGFVGVEFAGLHGHNPREIADLLDRLDLRISGSHTALPTIESERKMVETEATLGNNWLITGFGPNDFPTIEACRAASDKLNLAAELLRPHGMRLGYHNHWWEFNLIDHRRPFDVLLKSSPNVDFELDIYWAAMGGCDPAELIRAHSDRVRFLHVKDGPMVFGQPHTAVGSGNMDIAGAIQAADQDVLQWIVVELDDCATDMLEAVKRSYDYLTSNGLARGRK